MKIYLAGRMTGIAGYNYEAFREGATALREIIPNAAVINPADSYSGALDLDYRDYMRAAIHLILLSTHLVLLPGWEGSPGARFEVLMAQRLGLPVGELLNDDEVSWNGVPLLDSAEACDHAREEILDRVKPSPIGTTT